jgi:hypothetical protein
MSGVKNMTDKEKLISELKKKTAEDFSEKSAEELEVFLRKMLANYSEVLGYPEDEILTRLEERRDYSAVNFYQTANYPCLEDVDVLEDEAAVKVKLSSKQFKCPACGGISTNPHVCNSGKELSKGKICDWKSYGLMGTLGEGYKFVVKSNFLNNPIVYDIFPPIP